MRELNSVLGRTMTLLKAFRPSDTVVSLAELNRRTGIPKSTAHRLLAELAEWQIVERSGSGFRLGMRLFELGQLAPVQRGIREAAAPFLADLFEATHQTVHLAVLDGTDVVYLHKLEAKNCPPVGSRLGGRMPVYCTGVGKAMLAFAPTQLLDEVIAKGMRRRAPRTLVAPGVLGRELATVRASGFAQEREESAVGVACVAAPVLSADGSPLAAISVTGWSSQFKAATYAPAVRTAALGIARTLRL
jgi:DNA-binding IclR family transcriptional regulator